jgi:5-formyltetrahydrofolate cyclo-ligase
MIKAQRTLVMSQIELKKALRCRYLQWMRQNITATIALANGHLILQKLKAEREQAREQFVVSVFVSKCPEISTLPLINWLLEQGAQVHLPAWRDDEMWMCAIESRKEFESLLASAPKNRIPMPSSERIEIQVCM